MKNVFKSILFIGLAGLFFPLQSCKPDDPITPPTPGPSKNMYEQLVAEGNFTQMLFVIDNLGLKAKLSGTGGVTILAMTDDVLASDNIDFGNMNSTEVADFVNYHMFGQVMIPADFTNEEYYSSELATGPGGKKISIFVQADGDNIRFNGKNYIKKLESTNGIIYSLEGSLKPPTVLEALSINPTIKTYRTAVNLEAAVKADLAVSPNTIFATTEKKFNEYLVAKNTTVTSLAPGDRRTILHNSLIIGANKLDSELSATETTKGTAMTITKASGVITLNNKAVIAHANCQCTNGMLHIINDLLN